MLKQVYSFKLDGTPIFCQRYGSGHINETYLLVVSTARQYILQKINRHVFRDPASVMRNISLITAHFRKTATSSREVLRLNPTHEGLDWLVDENGDYWRLYDFVSDNICLDKAETTNDFQESAIAFGRFQRQLADFPVDMLTETIPLFHDTPSRYISLKQAVSADSHGRVSEVRREIDFALSRENYASVLVSAQARGDLPLRVTHNDTKLNNVLFDRQTRKALCVIDLDTVMPGLSVNDFGDSIRFGASTAAEDECDLDKVRFSLAYFHAYAEGFLSVCGESLTTCEIEHLPDGAKMMTLECGVRFLTDYLMGDIYFNTHREKQNLDRCRTQFKLVAEMERTWADMQRIITVVISRQS